MTDRIALAASVDLLVLGGGCGAVACALAARAQGLSVLICAPRPYLGDDACAHLRLRPMEPVADALAARLFPDGVAPRPLHLKRVLEGACVDAGVRLVLGAVPAGTVRDAAGAVRGAVVATRGGRHAVAARVVVDAGWLGPFARQAGASFAPWRGGTLSVERRWLGVAPADAGAAVEDLGLVMVPGAEGGPLPLVARTVEVALPDLSLPSLLAIEAQVKLAAFHPQARGCSEWGYFLPPVGLAGDERVAAWSGAGAFPLEACRRDEGRVWVLGPAAPVSRGVAAKLADPASACAIGTRLGIHLAQLLPSLPETRPAVAALGGAPMAGGSLRGHAGDFRPTGSGLGTIALDDGRAEALADLDVLVAGGGTGGAAAGIAAARAGARTLVCERLHGLGGVGTLGRIGRYWFGNRSGFTAELDAIVHGYGGDPRFPKQQGAWWALEWKQQAWLDLLARAGGNVWYGSQACAALVEGERVGGALIASIHGCGLVRAAATVDATGSADVAAAAGAPVRVTGAEHVAVQGTGLPPVDPRADYQNSDHDFCDDLDAEDVTRLLVAAKAKFPDAWDAGQLVDSRERRQIRGRYELAPLDILLDRGFDDAVVRATSNFDSHGFTVHPVFLVQPMDKKPLWAWVPYRCLLPQGLDGVLVTGLGMSAHRDALPVVRMQPDVQNAGFSAGTAAALAAQRGIGVAALPVRDLQRRLVELGHLPAEVLALGDRFPLPAAEVATLVRERIGDLLGVAAAFAQPAEAAAGLAEHLAAGGEAGARAALILGLGGQSSAAPALRVQLADAAWDAGWRFTGMGQFGATMSRVDAGIVALAHCGEAADLALVARLAALLQGEAELSHMRAVAWACTVFVRRHPSLRQAASALLARLLALPGIGGHHRSSLAPFIAEADADLRNVSVRERCLVELHLAVALLRCGDADGAARRTLEAYAGDLRGHYARHAVAVLAEAGARREAAA